MQSTLAGLPPPAYQGMSKPSYSGDKSGISQSYNEGHARSADSISSSLDDIMQDTYAQPGGSSYYGSDGAAATAIPAAEEGADYTSSVVAATMDDRLDMPKSTIKEQEFTYNEEDLSQVDKDLIFEGLKQLYRKKVLPLEIASKYAHFASPPMGPSDFDAKPMVLILGQYSVGKTSFIRSLLQQDFPGQRIGPEPTTDRFTAIMHAESGAQQSNRLLPGHALVMQASKPFRGLATFGNNFLSKFEGAEVNAPILKNITIVDTPGVLAGEKQRLGRDYDFSEVIKWFAERADMIIIMFDAHKLDISDELKSVLDALKPHSEKIRVLLNKADTIDTQSLLRVYGALMWSLGKVVQTPEVSRVYLGSFWEAPLKLEDNRALLEREKADLLHEMMALPQNAVVRRINELVKRARSVKVHAYIIHYLKKQMPYVIGKSEKQRKLLDRLDREFVACARRYNLPLGDFPNVDVYRKMLAEIKDISDFKRLDKNLVYEMDRVLTHDIPLLLQKATSKAPKSGSNSASSSGVNNVDTVIGSAAGTLPQVSSASGYSVLNPLRKLGFGAYSSQSNRQKGNYPAADVSARDPSLQYPEVVEVSPEQQLPPQPPQQPPQPQQPLSQQQQDYNRAQQYWKQQAQQPAAPQYMYPNSNYPYNNRPQ